MSRSKMYPQRIVAGMVVNGSTSFVRTSRRSTKVVLAGIGIFLLILSVEVILSVLSGN